MKQAPTSFATYLLLFVVLLATSSVLVDGQKCKPSGNIKGKKPPKGKYNQGDDSDCCEAGNANLHFEKGGDGGALSKCDGKYHSDDIPVVASSTGWFNNMKRCHKFIKIHGNGRSMKAMVVDECDSTMGCDKDHDYQPPCPNNIVDASKAVWKALGVKESDDRFGFMDVTWSDT
ncbi:hypothetical protein MANES_01G062200v8 [Manihot esculenta]|uniref:Uncharacterized protein n=1 Tax=Manihot esculenta TaxID=3983 RepID=A0A2C9WID0_MANES|nr:hypothetical protein MANES_01G062200v8 [Manihot esculenta]